MIESPFKSELLANHQYQGKTNDCGPVCMAIILNTLKSTSIDGLSLGQKLNKTKWMKGLPKVYRIKDWIVFPWGITASFREHEVKTKIHINKNIGWMFQQFSDGKILIPIVGRWKPLWGHYFIPVAWEKNNKIGFCNPAKNSNKIDWMQESDFIKYWKWSFNMALSITT
jgi:hypothetical protein